MLLGHWAMEGFAHRSGGRVGLAQDKTDERSARLDWPNFGGRGEPDPIAIAGHVRFSRCAVIVE
jgi:hypothetical protein